MHVIARPLAPRIVALVNPAGARRLLDVGGASGTYTLAFLQAVPEMRADALRPASGDRDGARAGGARPGCWTASRASREISNEDPLARGTTSRSSRRSSTRIRLRRTWRCSGRFSPRLEPGGRIVVRDHVLSPDRTEPLSGALFAVNMLVGTEAGNSYTEAEICDALRRAGFTAFGSSTATRVWTVWWRPSGPDRGILLRRRARDRR